MFEKRDNAESVKEVVERNTGIPSEKYLLDVRDPYLDHLEEAVQYVKDYIKANPGGRITIVGDYDSDGINATTIMYWGFLKLGITPILRIPHRMSEGYGLSEKIIDEIPSGLVLTVDNGIAAIDAIKKAKEKGLSVVVTDHHQPVRDKEGNMILPEADLIVDPHLDGDTSEFQDYCGAGISYRFVRKMFGAKFPELLVLASIATVTDVIPLYGANRTLVRDGLKYINKRRVVPGLEALLKMLELDDHISEGNYGFLLGPIFNASGRLYDNGAERVIKLLCIKRGDFTAKYKADALIKTNEKRKDIVKACMKKIKDGAKLSRPIVVYDPQIPEGIVGIVAGQLSEEYYCPAVVFTDSGKEGVIKGSGRSIPGLNLKAALDKIQQTMLEYGGHPGAAGLSIRRDRLDEFREAFSHAFGKLPDAPTDMKYDLELDPTTLEDVISELETYAPYGEGNPQIRFHTVFTVEQEEFRIIGDGTHFMVKAKDADVTLVGFGLTEKYKSQEFPNTIECVGYLNRDWYKGKDTIKFEILDFEAIS